jgi:hypothetical protein
MKLYKWLFGWGVALVALSFAPIDPAFAQVRVTEAIPSSANQGTLSLDVTVNGSGFDSTAQAVFLVSGTADTGGVTVRKTVVHGSKQLTATIDVAEDAFVGGFDIEVRLQNGRKGKGTTLFTVKGKTASIDPCLGQSPAMVFTKKATKYATSQDFYLSNASATCQRYLLSLSNGPYWRYSSFRMIASGSASEARIVTTDGGDQLLLIRFPVGPDMQVDPASISIQPIFDPTQPGFIDADNFDLASDGHRLVYVSRDEDGGTTFMSRLRYINDVDDCAPSGCQYDVGTLLAERVGLYYVLNSPRWSTDGSWIYLDDPRGSGLLNTAYIARVSVAQPLQLGQDPEIVVSGNALRLFELRLRGTEEVMAYADAGETGCRDVRVVVTSSCLNGSCTSRINSSTQRVFAIRWASIQSIDDSAVTILADGATESRKGSCSGTDSIVRAIDSAGGVSISTLVQGAGGPASK